MFRLEPERHEPPDAFSSLKAVALMIPTKAHRHKTVTTHVLGQRAGIPYEVERKTCSSCRRVLGERPLSGTKMRGAPDDAPRSVVLFVPTPGRGFRRGSAGSCCSGTEA